MKEIEAELPEKYKNASLFLMEKWKEYQEHISNSETYCIPPPAPHTLIKPFKHIEAHQSEQEHYPKH